VFFLLVKNITFIYINKYIFFSFSLLRSFSFFFLLTSTCQAIVYIHTLQLQTHTGNEYFFVSRSENIPFCDIKCHVINSSLFLLHIQKKNLDEEKEKKKNDNNVNNLDSHLIRKWQIQRQIFLSFFFVLSSVIRLLFDSYLSVYISI